MNEYNTGLSWSDIIVEVYLTAVFIYALFVMGSYLILSAISFYSSRKYIHRNQFVHYEDILNSTLSPGLSLLAPAYNEGATIIENIRSLLSIHYANFEVIVINDGSKDDTLQKCIDEYDLVKVDFAVDYKVATQEVRGVYKSRNKAFEHLTVVDKANGGKADALNCGINISGKDYIACIDVDCVLEQDAILKLMKPFLDRSKGEVIAVGGVIRIANSCKIVDGRLEEINVPDNMIARFQVLEYLRAFLLGRMAWTELDGLLLISGALGIFDKKLAIVAGGYNHKTVGEDMELVVRMRRYMHDHNKPYRVEFIPDPLCWTEAPESLKILSRQRNRWTRGTIETLLFHKKMFFNPKYGKIGMISYPFWLFFEWLAPLLEGMGYAITIILAIAGLINWDFVGWLMLLVYAFSVLFSVLALLIEEVTYFQYKKHSSILKLFLTGLIEPFFFHFFGVYCAILGNRDYLQKKSSWGEMTRKGFAKKT